MVGSKTAVAILAAALAAVGVSGCTYHSTLDSNFYTPQHADRTAEEKIPLKVALYKSDALEKLTLAESRGRHGVEIKLGDAVLSSLKTEMDGLFEQVTIVTNPREAAAAKADAIGFVVMDWKRTDTNDDSGGISYLVLLHVRLEDPELKFRVGEYRSIKPAYYSPSVGALAATAATGASLFLLAPITVPLATQAVGDRAEEVAKDAITAAVRDVGAKMAADATLRDYRATVRETPVQPRDTGGDVARAYAAPGGRYTQPRSLYDRFLDAVVVISTPSAIGTGFFISPDGYIVTNHHVIGERATASVKLRSGPTLTAVTVATNSIKDLALLKISGDGFRWLELSTGAEAGVGRDVLAIGTPRGLSWSVSKGIVSAVRDQRGVRFIQTDAAINSGNSGGPLIDLASGKVIGVNTLGVRKDLAEGLNFAVSAEDVRMIFGRYVHLGGQS
ncbi:MAG: S1C family serine protease [Candidatus Eiseniibacteriota bacterium]